MQVPKPVQDPEGKDSDQSAYVTSRFQDVTVYDTLKGSSSMTGDDSSVSDAIKKHCFNHETATQDH